MTDPETVFVATGSFVKAPRTVHVDPDCKRLSKAHNVAEKPLAVYPPSSREWCQWCASEDGPPGPDRAGTKTLGELARGRERTSDGRFA